MFTARGRGVTVVSGLKDRASKRALIAVSVCLPCLVVCSGDLMECSDPIEYTDELMECTDGLIGYTGDHNEAPDSTVRCTQRL